MLYFPQNSILIDEQSVIKSSSNCCIVLGKINEITLLFTQEGLEEGNVTQGLEVTMNESIVDSVDSGSRSR